MSLPRLETEDLALQAGGRDLVRNLNLAMAGGQNWAILGANGSGKTTLIHTLAGLRPPASGVVRLDGQPIEQVPARLRARRMAVLFQQHTTAFPATVLETVLTGRHPWLDRWQDEGPADLALARDALATVGLQDLSNRSMLTLSGGERRRVELAALLAQDTPIGLLDEPVNHLDPRFQTELLQGLCRHAIHDRRLNLIVMHDINLALRHCTHGLLLLPDGFRAGSLAEIVDRKSLEMAYGCPMREIQDHGERWFFPD